MGARFLDSACSCVFVRVFCATSPRGPLDYCVHHMNAIILHTFPCLRAREMRTRRHHFAYTHPCVRVRARKCEHTQGHVIHSVAWNKNSTPSTTREILVGTSKGLILECEIEPSEAGFFAGKEEKYVRPV